METKDKVGTRAHSLKRKRMSLVNSGGRSRGHGPGAGSTHDGNEKKRLS